MEANLLISDDIVKTSFFDDLDDKSIAKLDDLPQNQLYISVREFETFADGNPNISQKILMEGNLLNKSKRTNTMKNYHYTLLEDRLIQYKNDKKEKIKKILYLKGVKLEVFNDVDEDKNDEPASELERQCFFFSRNKKYDLVFASNKEDYNAWLQQLNKVCILTYFGKYYNNLKVIGKGTFAKVILSKRLSDGAEFAVKTFEKKNILASKSANRTKVGLINEINIMRNVSHPNIIKLFEVYEGEYHIYLVMELLRGGELFDKIVKKGHYSEKDAAILIRKLLQALEYIHEKGIMHRDIKPENLILKDDDEFDIKLADFGLSEYENKKEHLFKRCGTPGYVAPEVLEDKKYDRKVDIFSTGVILYILLTGCSPFYGKSYNEILSKNKHCIVNYNFQEINLKLSENAVDLLKRMLSKDPNGRPTATECLNHPWLMQENEINHLEVQNNMKKFQEERPNLKLSKPKPEELICNSPLITGKTDGVPSKTDSPIGSPLTVGGKKENNDLHKNVLLKNMKDDPNFKDILLKKKPEEPSKIEPKLEQKIESKLAPQSYVASPLRKKPNPSDLGKRVYSNLKDEH